jgi:putative sterol carrier protein
MFACAFHIKPVRSIGTWKKEDVKMSVIDEAVAALSERLSGGFDGSVKFVIEGEGALMVDGGGVRAADDDDDGADVTMTASADTFEDILAGALNPAAAFMSGKLKLDGDMGTAMRLGSVLG